jgi:serine/threonine protein kinase
MENVMINFPNRPDCDPVNLSKVDLDKEEFVCKIGDFGLARKLDNKRYAQSFVGTPQYMAPDILLQSKHGDQYSFKVDIWSMGVLFYFLITGNPLFDGATMKDLGAQVKKGDWYLPASTNLSAQGILFINSILTFEEDDRLTWPEIMQHDYLNIEKKLLFITHDELSTITPNPSISNNSSPCGSPRSKNSKSSKNSGKHDDADSSGYESNDSLGMSTRKSSEFSSKLKKKIGEHKLKSSQFAPPSKFAEDDQVSGDDSMKDEESDTEEEF